MRYGAGRPAWKVKAECCRAIDVRRFAAENMLQHGAWIWQWRDRDTSEVRSSIGVYGRPDGVTLDFEVHGVPVRLDVSVTKTACNYGGSRPWFACPCCGRRVAKLFLRAQRFACRRCQRVSYASQSEDAIGRSWRRQQKLETQLGPDWQRPGHMRAGKHAKLIEQILDCESRRDAALVQFIRGRFPGALKA